jgi:hypothetical protein
MLKYLFNKPLLSTIDHINQNNYNYLHADYINLRYIVAN